MDRSTIPQNALRSTFAPCWGSGLLLFSTFLMPLILVPSCGAATHQSFYPIDFYRTADSAAKIVMANAYTWPYWFGLTVAGGTLYVSIRSKPSAFRVLWLAYAILSCCTALTGGWLALLASATLFVGTIWERASALRALGIKPPSRGRAVSSPAGGNTMPMRPTAAAPVGTVRGA